MHQKFTNCHMLSKLSLVDFCNWLGNAYFVIVEIGLAYCFFVVRNRYFSVKEYINTVNSLFSHIIFTYFT